MKQKLSKNQYITMTGAAFGCILFLLSFLIINFRLFPEFCDSDMFVDLYPARLMWEQKKLFPEGWVFGNQYFVIASPVWTAFFYGLTGKLCFSMALAVTLLTFLIGAAWLWMLQPMRRDRSVGAMLLSLLLLLGGMIGYDIVHTQQGQLFFLCTAYYASYLLTLFLVYGCYVRDNREQTYSPVLYVLALALCFATGMQSLRQTAVMIMPLGCVEALRQLIVFRENKKLVRKEILRGSKCLGYAISNAAGFLFIKLILKPAHHNVYGNTSSRDAKDTVEGIRTSFVSLFGTMGLDPAAVTKQGAVRIMLGLLAVLLAAAVLYTTIRLIRTKEKDGYLYVVVLFWIGVLGVLLPGCFLNIVVRPIYYFTWYPLGAVSLYYIWEKAEKRTLTGAAVALFLTGNYLGSYFPSVREAMHPKQTEEKEIAAYVTENGYSYLYGDWSYVLAVAMTADGGFIPGGWYFEPYEVLGYVNPLGIYREEDNEKALLLLKKEDTEALKIARERGAQMEPVYETQGYVLYRSDKQLMHE